MLLFKIQAKEVEQNGTGGAIGHYIYTKLIKKNKILLFVIKNFRFLSFTLTKG